MSTDSRQNDDSPLDNYQFDPSVDMSGYIPIENRMESPKQKNDNIITEQSLLDPAFEFPSEAIIEQNAFVRSQCANRKNCPKNSECNPGCFAPVVHFF